MRKLKQLSALLLAAVLIFTTVDTQGLCVKAGEVSSDVTTETMETTEQIIAEEALTQEVTTEEAATEETTTEQTAEEATRPATDSDAQEEETSVEKLINMIDALPNADEITDENRETAIAGFTAVFAEYEKLLADETITDLDGQLGAERMQKLTALREVLFDMVNLAGEVYGLLKENGEVYAADSDGTQTDGGTTIEKNTVTHLFVGSDVTKINNSAFFGCNSLTAVDLSKATKLQIIDDSAFRGCTELTTVDLSKATTLETIGIQAFFQCTNLTTVSLSGATELDKIGNSAFAGCTGLTTVDLSNAAKLHTIENDAFLGCTKLTTVDLSNATKLDKIGNSAFRGCTKLTTVDLSGATALKTIDGQAFSGTGITSITIPASVPQIGNQAFYECTSLTTVNLSDAAALQTIGFGAFQGTGITSITIPASVTQIGQNAFYNCDNLTTVDLSKATALQTIDIQAFLSCDNLTTVDLSKATALQTIGEEAFVGCIKLTAVDLSGATALQTIGLQAFWRCDNLTTVDLSSATALQTIGQNAFLGCSKLTTVDLSGATALETIDSQAFQKTGIATITIPESVTQIGDSAFDGCTNLTTVDLSKAEKLETIGNKAFFNCTKLTTVDLSSATALQTIGDQAFQETGITEITLPESVTQIGGMAFSQTGITEITIPANVTDIRGAVGWTFGACANLNTVTFKGITPPIIGASIFGRCDALETIYVPNGSKDAYAAAANLTEYAGKMVGYKLETEFAGGVTTDKTEYTTPDVITVTVTPTADKIIPQTFALTPPDAEEIALFVGETQITAPQNAAIGTELTFTVATIGTEVKAALKNGKNTITAKYAGGANSTDCIGTVTVTVHGLPIDFTSEDHSTATLEDNGYTWTGDAADGYTLTLKDLRLTSDYGPAITLPDADVHIVLAGKTTLDTSQAAIFSEGTAGAHTVTISGDGSLSAASAKSVGIDIVQSLSITGGTLAIKGIMGIGSYGSIEITGGKITGNAIMAQKALTISGDTVDVSVEGTYQYNAIQAVENITIKDGTVTATSTNGNGILSSDTIIISGGTVNAASTNASGLFAGKTVEISGGSVTAKGGKTAILGGSITLTGMGITAPAGAAVGNSVSEPDVKAIMLNGKDVHDVTIAKLQATRVTGLTMNRTTAGIKVKKTVQLSVTVAPEKATNKTVKWSTSNSKVATVSSKGKVTGKKAGTCTITATAKDGSGKKATCKITVSNQTITYKLNKGKNAAANPAVYLKNQSVTLKNPTRKGYTFSGWYTNSKFKSGSRIKKIAKGNTKNFKLYAKWTKVKVAKAATPALTNTKAGRLTIKYSKVSSVKGYEITYATDSKFKKNKKTVTTSKTSKTITKLKKGKTYYVKVRAYKVDSTGKKVYGSYSKVKSIKLKK